MMPGIPRNTLPKRERISAKKDIDDLIAKGKFHVFHDLKYCVRTDTGTGINRMMVSVGKRFFKRAVKRNLLKRRIRESYRLQKHLLPQEGGVDVLFIYATKEILSQEEIFNQVGEIIRNISHGQGKSQTDD